MWLCQFSNYVTAKNSNIFFLKLGKLDKHVIVNTFGRSWVRFLSGTQIFSLTHARVVLNNSSFTFHYRTQNSPSSFTYKKIIVTGRNSRSTLG